MPDDVLDFIASHVKDNIRELEGALTRICAFANLNKEPISLAQAEKVLSDLVLAGEPRRITPQMILDATSASYGFSVDAICGPSRTRPLVTARQVAMYLTRELTDYSYPGHRPRLRQAGPHDRHPRRGQDRRPDAGTPADLRAGHRTDPEDPCRLGLTRPPTQPPPTSLWFAGGKGCGPRPRPLGTGATLVPKPRLGLRA